MKKKILMIAILIFTCFSYGSRAQVSVNFNLGIQPLWGPTGYDYAEYYYMPDIDVYYNVPAQQYVYYDNTRWVTVSSLPPRYRNFDLYRAHKVVINEPSPWLHHDRYRTQYSTYRGRHDQVVIRDSRDSRYWANPRHPQHSRWNGNRQEKHRDWGGNRPGKGNGRGHDKGHGNGHGNGHGRGHK